MKDYIFEIQIIPVTEYTPVIKKYFIWGMFSDNKQENIFASIACKTRFKDHAAAVAAANEFAFDNQLKLQ